MTKFHAEFPNYMQHLLTCWQLGDVVRKLGVGGCKNITDSQADL